MGAFTFRAIVRAIAAPFVAVWRMLRARCGPPPRDLRDSLAADLAATGVLREAKSPGSFDHLAALVARDCRWRVSISADQALAVLEGAVAASREGEYSPAGGRAMADLLAYRVNAGKLN